jgi:multidrug efflux pump subunit AcrB
VPGGFVPPEDQGYILGSLTLPDAATLQRTADAGATIQRILLGHPAVEHVFVVAGFDVIAGANKSNAATMFIPLHPWDERKATAEDLAKCDRRRLKLSQGTLLAFSRSHSRSRQRRRVESTCRTRADADPQKLYQNLQQFPGERANGRAYRHRVVLSADISAVRRCRPRKRSRRSACR